MNKIKKALYSIMTILLVNSAIVGCNKGNGNSGDISFDSSRNFTSSIKW